MMTVFVNVVIYKGVQALDQFDSRATDEQMVVKRAQAAIVSCLCSTALSVGLFVFFGLLTSNGFVGPSIIVFLTA